MSGRRLLVGTLAIPLAVRGIAACVGADPVNTGPGAADSGGADSPVTPADAALDASADGGTTDAAACDPTKPFGAPVNVPNVNSPQEEGHVTLTGDELTMYLASERGGNWDIYMTTRATKADIFAIPQREDVLSHATGIDQGPSVSLDGNRIYLRSNRAAAYANTNIWTTGRQASGIDFPAPGLAQKINMDSDDVDPYLQANGQRLYFASNRTGGATVYTLFESAVVAGTTEDPAPVLGALPDAGGRFPVISADGLTLWFATNVQHPDASGDLDIWMAKRSTPSGAFDPGAPVKALNSQVDDEPGWISPDGCALYMMSRRPSGAGQTDLWVARRPN